MRLLSALLVLFLPVIVTAQTPDEKAATLKYIAGLYDSDAGAYKVDSKSKASLSACNGASKATGYMGGKVANKEKTAAFVLKCYDPAAGTFADPGGKPGVGSTSIGVITAVEYGIPKQKFPKVLDYLKENAKTFDDVRIGAAALEALKEKPVWVDRWIEISTVYVKSLHDTVSDPAENKQITGSVGAMWLRLGRTLNETAINLKSVTDGQNADGAYGKTKSSDLESTYRVLRFLFLAKAKPADPAKLRGFIAKCRNTDGGYGVEPGKPSNIGGTYYAATVLHWLGELEK